MPAARRLHRQRAQPVQTVMIKSVRIPVLFACQYRHIPTSLPSHHFSDDLIAAGKTPFTQCAQLLALSTKRKFKIMLTMASFSCVRPVALARASAGRLAPSACSTQVPRGVKPGPASGTARRESVCRCVLCALWSGAGHQVEVGLVLIVRSLSVGSCWTYA